MPMSKRAVLAWNVIVISAVAVSGRSTLIRGEVHLERKRGSSHTPLGPLPRKARRTSMDPTTVCCPHRACPARGRVGQRNIGIHSHKAKRFIGTPCRKTCAETTGTVCSRLRTPAETVMLAITLLAQGCPLQAMVVACGFAARTGADWGGPHWPPGARGAGASGRAAPGARGGASRCEPRQEAGRCRLEGAGHAGPYPLVARRRGARAL